MKLNSLFILNIYGSPAIQLAVYQLRDRICDILAVESTVEIKKLISSMHSWKDAIVLHYPENECTPQVIADEIQRFVGAVMFDMGVCAQWDIFDAEALDVFLEDIMPYENT